MFKPTLLGVALATASFVAQATVTAANGQLPGSFIDLSTSGTVTGGAVYTQAENYGNTVAARPENDSPLFTTSGHWLAAGPGNGGDATLNLGAGINAVSFLWGSPDNYNSFVVNVSGGPNGSFSFLPTDTQWAALGIPLNGDQTKAYYITFSTDVGTINSIVFKSTQNALEVANVTAVPEPEAYGLALAGLSVVGFAMARRRKN